MTQSRNGRLFVAGVTPPTAEERTYCTVSKAPPSSPGLGGAVLRASAPLMDDLTEPVLGRKGELSYEGDEVGSLRARLTARRK